MEGGILYWLLLAVLLGDALTDGPYIPRKPLGYVFRAGNNTGDPGAPIQLEMYLDLMCEGSKRAFPVVTSLPSNYSTELRLVIHSFPMTFYRNAFLAALGNRVADVVSSGTLTFNWMVRFFDLQEEFTSDATRDISESKIIDRMFCEVAWPLGILADPFYMSMDRPELQAMTREDAQYGCSRNVAGTPWFMINGITIQAEPSWTIDDWKHLIDELLS